MKLFFGWPIQLLTTSTLITAVFANGSLGGRDPTIGTCKPKAGQQRIQVLDSAQGILHDIHVPTDGIKRTVLGPSSELKTIYSKVRGGCDTAAIDFNIIAFEVVGTENMCTMHTNRGKAQRSETFTSSDGQVKVEEGTTLEAIDCFPIVPALTISRRNFDRSLPLPIQRDVDNKASLFANATQETAQDQQQGCRDREGAQRINFYTEDDKLYSLFVPKDGLVKWLEPAVWDCNYQIANGWGCGVCSRTKFTEFTLEREGSCFMRFHTSPGGAWLEVRVTKGWWFMNGLFPGAVVCFEPGADGHPVSNSDPTTSAMSEQFPGDSNTHFIATAPSPKRAEPTALAKVTASTTFTTSLTLSKPVLPRATATSTPKGCAVSTDTTKTRQVNLFAGDTVYQVYVPIDGKTYNLTDADPDLRCLQNVVAEDYVNGNCGSCCHKIDHLQHTGDTPCKIRVATKADGTGAEAWTISRAGFPVVLPYSGWPLSITCNLF